MTARPNRDPVANSAFEGFLLDRVDVAVIANDERGRITHWNRFAEELFGWSRREAIGRDA